MANVREISRKVVVELRLDLTLVELNELVAILSDTVPELRYDSVNELLEQLRNLKESYQ